ncbi:hypothetical protein ACFE04_029788 [Oxalis oulophora]
MCSTYNHQYDHSQATIYPLKYSTTRKLLLLSSSPSPSADSSLNKLLAGAAKGQSEGGLDSNLRKAPSSVPNPTQNNHGRPLIEIPPLRALPRSTQEQLTFEAYSGSDSPHLLKTWRL